MTLSTVLFIIAVGIFLYAAWKGRPEGSLIPLGLAVFAAAFVIAGVVLK
jgi:hypothetical protein